MSMVKDSHFDLLLHEDQELERLIGGTLVERETFHHWPLSNVQRIKLSDGRRYIYKANAGQTVEGKFYSNARSPLLVPARILYDADGYLCMLLDFVEAQKLSELKLPEEETLLRARVIAERIAEIEGDLPAVCDLRGQEKWGAYVEGTIEMLDRLVKEGKFLQTDNTTVRRVEALAMSEPVLAVINGPSAYIHGDLGGDNILKLPDGYRIIDWARPFWGPADLNVFDALANADYNPMHYFGRGLAMVEAFLRLNWAAQCKFSWIRDGECYDDWVVGFSRHMIRCAEGKWEPFHP